MASTVRSSDTLGGSPEDAGGSARLLRTYVRFIALILLTAAPHALAQCEITRLSGGAQVHLPGVGDFHHVSRFGRMVFGGTSR